MTWTTAYLAALGDPDGTPSFMPQPRSFSAQTVRQAVRLRRGGGALRLVLSNEFGHTPLVIDEVTAADGMPVLCQGGARWEIPPGRTATSDPVPLTTAAGDEFVISCFVSGDAEPAAYLHSAQRTGEVLHSAERTGEVLPGAERFTSLYWITRVLTDAPAAGPVVVALGDSITRGDGTSADRDQRYADHLQRRLLAAGLEGAAVLNAGIGGNRLLGPLFGPTMTERFARDVLGVPEATHVLIMGGLNDLAMGSPADDITGALFALARRAQRHGVQPILGTVTPMMGSVYEMFRADGNEEARRAVNQAITGQRDWHVADFAAALADPDDPTRLAAAFDSGDGVHPGDAGARALAETVDLDLFK
ncbi:SGNH/GDSL hydrolase family protein [Actinoallomurus bryophytorum]|uniref:Lysophospholipase L1-like esterase n=1 Tax=Actinoallomurus bryophytorum TaxID=1490222 RepID=A0A543CT52_9ACTN|nr:GDSL-type esterase/lipase family protein [Actinoallomurus bryophytorum]TQM00282.1 lysophospholipase L1-like esterase [Actinoallomurus bryophytorum]